MKFGCTDPEGKIWSYEYDGEHRMTGLIDPLAVTTAVNTYDGSGRVTSLLFDPRSFAHRNRFWPKLRYPKPEGNESLHPSIPTDYGS